LDNLTHSLTGIFLSRAGLHRLTPRASWILLLAANAPDVDVVSAFGGALNYLHYHRNVTHALVSLPVLPLFVVLVVRALSRKPLNWLGAYLVALIGVASHLVLDLTNVYGVRLLLPFSGRWFHWDITSVIDFWIWGVLLLAMAGPLFARLVNAEIGANIHNKVPAGRGFAIFALAFLASYNGGRYLMHARAVSTLDSRIYAGATPQRVAAFPGPVNVFQWRGLAEMPDVVSIQDIDLLRGFDPSAGHLFYKPEPSQAIDAARRNPVFEGFFEFSQYPFWEVNPAGQPEGGTRVEAMDLRFGDPQSPGFTATAIMDAHQKVLRAWFAFGGAQPR
jgi:inner membrane protein